MEKPAEGPHLRRETAAGSGKEAPFPQGMNACKDREGILAETHTTSLHCMHPNIKKEQAPTAPTRNTAIVTETQQEERRKRLHFKQNQDRGSSRASNFAWKISSFFFLTLSLRSALNREILRDAARGRGHHRSKRRGGKSEERQRRLVLTPMRSAVRIGFVYPHFSPRPFLFFFYSGSISISLLSLCLSYFLSRDLPVVVGAPAQLCI